MDNATQLQTSGIEPTDKRVTIFSHFVDSPTPLSATQLIKLMKDKRVHRSTVFRAVKLFEEKQLIKRIDFAEGESRFEIANLPHHHHAVCRTCGGIELIDDCITDRIQKNIKKRLGFSTVDHSLTLFGVCKKCKDLV
ncbi:MAG: Fur family transcriptional regulator [Candidatus Roizmanbacteria bacterium]|nr:Fur family transcriptional regulator [Candidatus Roizmanbacteria bacterium]